MKTQSIRNMPDMTNNVKRKKPARPGSTAKPKYYFILKTDMSACETQQIRTFILKLAIFCLPFIIPITMNILMDPFKVWFNHDEYYKNNFVTMNRELVCLKLFNRNLNHEKYNSYIFGSSRSQAYKVPEWKKYLSPQSSGFHFDSHGEGLYGIYTKIKYIKSKNLPIDNALIILDYETFQITKNRRGYLAISPPELSGESSFSFFGEFFLANLDPKFTIGYLDYRIFHTYRDYMKSLFNKWKFDNISDNLTGDLYYGYDRMIAENKQGYYNNLIKKGVFYDRAKKSAKNEIPICEDEKKLLVQMHEFFLQARTRYKIVVSPLYDQKKLSKERINLLTSIFGAENVYDFSGINTYTHSIYNYYEDSHYRPNVANDIMSTIYKQ